MFSNYGSKHVVYTAIIAALYTLFVYALAPISYGPLQLRVACFLYPLALFNPAYSFGFGLGTFLSNIGSPFGLWDIVAMPIVATLAGLVCWRVRRFPLVAISTQATIIAAGVSIFPLHLGGNLPILVTFPGVLLSQLIVICLGYYIVWRPLRQLPIFRKDE